MALVIDSLCKRYGAVAALDGISFVAQPGQVFGFLGPNGAGKTTTMRIVLDIIHADAGSVTWAGRPAADAPRRTWGYLPEERGLYPRMKVLDQLVFVAALHGVPRDEAAQRARHWLNRFRIGDARRAPGRAAEQGQPAEGPVHRGDPPRPRCPAPGRAVLGTRPDQRVAAQGGLPRAARSGQGDRLQHAPDGGGRGAVRRDRDHRSRPAGPLGPGPQREAAGRPGRRPPRRRRRSAPRLAQGTARTRPSVGRASTTTRSSWAMTPIPRRSSVRPSSATRT